MGVYLLINLTHTFVLGKTVYGDGIFYYCWLRSLVVDQDLDFTNDLAYFQTPAPLLPSGKPANKYSIGPTLAWLPTFIWTHNLLRGDGFSFPYQLAVSIQATLSALTGLILLYRWLRNFFSDLISALTISTLALSTNLLYYGAVDSVNSHATAFLASTLFLNLLFTVRPNWLLIGSSLGFMFLIRPQDAIFAILVLPLFGQVKFHKLILGFFLIASWQLLLWKIIHGSFVSPYLLYGEKFNWTNAQIIPVLFSASNGLFFWTPILLVSTLGLFLTKNLKLKVIFVTLLGIQLYLISSWQVWWQGAAFGGRMFVSLLPIFAFGLATLLKRYKAHLHNSYLILSIFTLMNFTALVYFLLHN